MLRLYGLKAGKITALTCLSVVSCSSSSVRPSQFHTSLAAVAEVALGVAVHLSVIAGNYCSADKWREGSRFHFHVLMLSRHQHTEVLVAAGIGACM